MTGAVNCETLSRESGKRGKFLGINSKSSTFAKGDKEAV
jgi:hypothetical protein